MNLEFGVFDHLDRNDLPLRAYYEQRLKVIEAFETNNSLTRKIKIIP